MDPTNMQEVMDGSSVSSADSSGSYWTNTARSIISSNSDEHGNMVEYTLVDYVMPTVEVSEMELRSMRTSVENLFAVMRGRPKGGVGRQTTGALPKRNTNEE
ncbi:hypothetical protein DQ04_22131000 [Trypanosoma grayi]|uniref:hypothetical protein n=1 Tax=Trypanosoma grayi TaxID=71804 RepID=UPI0004F417FB|nr:hypothetical protein DQ04_22131000 [Trypanosoma grayi]KEG05424.1 hypothetical protein DQ04_22131000 [Trypanosoma grayi]